MIDPVYAGERALLLHDGNKAESVCKLGVFGGPGSSLVQRLINAIKYVHGSGSGPP